MTSAPDIVGCDKPAIGYGAIQPIATLFMIIFSLKYTNYQLKYEKTGKSQEILNFVLFYFVCIHIL
ncbi:hypothetical protein [Peptoniphilus porci]|uniref:Uncharacterized protein n=1 Tax=Peptoniphilus porci TaxID=2652280 RepID=A0A1U7M0N0_9FIRM|nr:hypothetical protein [Peptoniphilus porci]OLR65225.1 hypothetical protein BIV18_06720 [Peptoniphilus porci]